MVDTRHTVVGLDTVYNIKAAQSCMTTAGYEVVITSLTARPALPESRFGNVVPLAVQDRLIDPA